MRLDCFLWWARLAKTRAAARTIATTGTLRIDGRVITRAHCDVGIGNVVTFYAHGRVHVVRVETLPTRRGPPAEARACYTDLDPANVSQQGMAD